MRRAGAQFRHSALASARGVASKLPSPPPLRHIEMFVEFLRRAAGDELSIDRLRAASHSWCSRSRRARVKRSSRLLRSVASGVSMKGCRSASGEGSSGCVRNSSVEQRKAH